MADNHVKIRFPLQQDENGYPPEDAETLWAVDLGNGVYRLDNIPFYVSLVSDGDIISAHREGEGLTFDGVLEASRNCTIRVLVKDISDPATIRRDLEVFGCKIEGSGIRGFFSVSCDKDIYPTVSQYLESRCDTGEIDYEESSLR